jgi:hypothetical protein
METSNRVNSGVVEDIWMNTQVREDEGRSGYTDGEGRGGYMGGEGAVGHIGGNGRGDYTGGNAPADSREIEQATYLINPDPDSMERG